MIRLQLAEADEIVPHVFVGNFKAANVSEPPTASIVCPMTSLLLLLQDASFLRSKGITHVLNVAHADKKEAGCYIVDTNKIDGKMEAEEMRSC